MTRLWPYRGWLVPVAALILTELGLRQLGIESQGLALPSEVIVALKDIIASGVIFVRTWETLLAIGLGLAVGGGLGVLGGIGLGLSPAASRITSIAIELFRPIPPVAVIPIALLIYGFGIKMEAAIIAFTCFWPMLLLTQAAVSSVEPRLIEVSRILELSPRKKVMSIVLPAAAARIVTALRLTIGIAFIVAVTTEIAVNPFGLGHAMMISQMEMRPSFMYAYISWLAALGWLINTGLLMIQRRMFGAMGLEVTQ
jgi:ABC-type nitrate/sulfonate/bicarbonate transport system permease component